MKHITKTETESELRMYLLKDVYNKALLIQESSSAEEPRIWVGEAHLNREQAKELITILDDFAENKGEYFQAWEDPQKEFKQAIENLIAAYKILSAETFIEFKDKFIEKWKPE